MDAWDGFEVLETVKGTPSMSVTKNGVAFNKTVVEKMRAPQFAVPLIDKSRKRFAVIACGENDRGSREFFKPGRDLSYGARWNNYDLRSTLEQMMGWDLSRAGQKIPGTYSEEKNGFIFDLMDAVEITK